MALHAFVGLKASILRTKPLLSFSQFIKRMGLKSVDIGLNFEGGTGSPPNLQRDLSLLIFTSFLPLCHMAMLGLPVSPT